jgi:4'-phosphopantetheinyl transferase
MGLAGKNASDMKHDPSVWVPAEHVDIPASDTIHLCCVRLLSGSTDRLRELLSTDELARADRFVFEDDRRRFTVARAVLRQILASYLDLSASSIAFQYGDNGKPALDSALDLEFNLSHSGDFAVYAFGCGRRLGIDIESVAAGNNPERVAERFFTPGENASLLRLPPEERQRAFVTFWVRKEAYLKACGEGLFTSPEAFETTLDDPPRILSVGGDAGAASEWTLTDFAPAAGYHAALVQDGGAAQIERYAWESAAD